MTDQAARSAALDLTSHVLVRAPAGSGKTGLLVQRFLTCLTHASQPEEVVAITFTRKAAGEMRERVVEAMKQAAQNSASTAPKNDYQRRTRDLACAVLAHDEKSGWGLLSNPARLRVSTIDGLNAELANQLPVASGLGGSISVIEDPRIAYDDAIAELFGSIEDPDTPAQITTSLAVVLRDGSNRLDKLAAPLRELLSRREQWLDSVAAAREAIDAGAFDLSAVEDFLQAHYLKCVDRLRSELGVPQIEDLLGILQRAATTDEKNVLSGDYSAVPEVSDRARWAELVEVIATKEICLRKPGGVNKNSGFAPKKESTKDFKAWLEAIHEDADRVRRIDDAMATFMAAPDPQLPEELLEFQAALVRVLHYLSGHLLLSFQRNGGVDFNEIALRANQALVGTGGYSEVLGRADYQIRHLLVDEMQDTSVGQIRLLEQLTSGWMPGDGHSLFLVGDPQQSIYGFRAAEVRIFLRLWEARQLGDLPLEPLTLNANYRSAPSLIDWFNDAFARVFPPQADIDAGLVTYEASVAGATIEQAAESESSRQALSDSVSLRPLINGSRADEADVVVAEIRALQAKCSSGTIAVLGRSRSALFPVVEALRAADIACRCTEIESLQGSSALQDVLQLILALDQHEDRVAWATVLRSPWVGLRWADMVALSVGERDSNWLIRCRRAAACGMSDDGNKRLERFLAVLADIEQDERFSDDLIASAQAVWQRMGGPGAISNADYADIQLLFALARSECAGGLLKDRDIFTQRVEQLYRSPSPGIVDVMTVHKSKGLEFDHVFVVGCGAAGRAESKPLLHKMPIDDDYLLVPKPPGHLAADHPAHRLYAYIHQRHSDSSKNELMRVLYVALTRAKQRLFIVGSVKLKGKGEMSPRNDTFLSLLWPVVAADYEVALARYLDLPAADESSAPKNTAESDQLAVPYSPRLASEWRYCPEPSPFNPAIRTTLKPSESAINVDAVQQRDGELSDQLIGTMYHLALERVADDGIASWERVDASRRHAIAAGLRRMGLPEPDIEGAVTRIADLVERTTASQDGAFVLSDAHDWHAAEFHLAGFIGGHWMSGLIDRCFLSDGVMWIVDYKASSNPISETQLDRYRERSIERYRGQLASYRLLMQGRFPDVPIRTALYLAETASLVEVD